MPTQPVTILLRTLLVIAAFTAVPIRAVTILRGEPTATAPVIDGKLADQCWQQATMASGFITNYAEWPRAQTTAFVTYDDINIYIAFRCNTTADTTLVSKTTANDDEAIFGDSSVEIFLDTNHDRTTYYQLVVNPAGVRYEAYIKPDDGIRDAEVTFDWAIATETLEDSWTVEGRISFAALDVAAPKAGDVWGINLNRNYYEEGLSEHSSWAMIQGGFNRPRDFGELHFGSRPDVSYSILGMTGDDMRLKLRNNIDVPLLAEAEWATADWLGAPVSRLTTTRLAANEEKEVVLRYKPRSRKIVDVPLTQTGPKMALTVRNAKRRQIYDSRAAWINWGGFAFPPFPEVSLDRYYYPQDVPQAEVSLTARLEHANRFEIEVRQEHNGPVLAAQQIPIDDSQKTYTASFDLGPLNFGRYVMTAHLFDDTEERLHSVHRIFYKKNIAPAKLPTPAPEISIRSDGIILLDKKPFCPFFASKPTSPLCDDTFNVRFGSQGVVSRPLERLPLAFPGLTRDFGPLAMVLPAEEEFKAHLRSAVAGHTNDPLVLCWFMTYESEFPMYRVQGSPKAQGKTRTRLLNADELRRISAYIKSIDPNHLTALQIDQGHWARYKDSADIIEVGCPGSSYMRQMIPAIIDDVKDVRSELGPGKPFIVWIGASLPHPRTAEELRGATYLALMNGASGIVFHMGHGGIDNSLTRHWSVYTGLSRELELLFPILAAKKLNNERSVRVEPTGPIAFCIREFEGRVYLVAVNTSDSIVTANFSIGDFADMLINVRLPFENRTVSPERNEFTDTFTSFEPHAYELIFAK